MNGDDKLYPYTDEHRFGYLPYEVHIPWKMRLYCLKHGVGSETVPVILVPEIDAKGKGKVWLKCAQCEQEKTRRESETDTGMI